MPELSESHTRHADFGESPLAASSRGLTVNPAVPVSCVSAWTKCIAPSPGHSETVVPDVRRIVHRVWQIKCCLLHLKTLVISLNALKVVGMASLELYSKVRTPPVCLFFSV